MAPLALIVALSAITAALGACGGGTGSLGPRAASSRLPAAIYPQPIPAERPNLPQSTCPNPYGIQMPHRGDRPAVIRALHQLNGKAHHDQRFTDPALWPVVVRYPLPDPFRVREGVHGPRVTWVVRLNARPRGPVPHGPSGPPGTACPPKVIARTWTLVLGPPGRDSAALLTRYYLIERDGHWLLWYSYP